MNHMWAQADRSGSKLFDALLVFLKECFETVVFEKNQQTTKKSAKNPVDRYIRFRLLCIYAWVKVFRIIPEFRILRLTSIESQPQNAEFCR